MSAQLRPKPKMGMGAKMAGGNPDPLRGRALDDFYATPAPVTRALFNHYRERLTGAKVWEPCAGDGAMADELLACGVGQVICSDLRPQATRNRHAPYRILQGDVMTVTGMPAVDAIITNPPFFLAADMIRHILTLRGGPPPFLALVLKSTFWHAAARGTLFDTLPPSAVHPLRWRPDFKSLGAPTMEISWVVWDEQDRDSLTTYEPFNHPGNE